MKITPASIAPGDYICFPGGRDDWRYYRVEEVLDRDRIMIVGFEFTSPRLQYNVGVVTSSRFSNREQYYWRYPDSAFYERHGLHEELERMARLGLVSDLNVLELKC